MRALLVIRGLVALTFSVHLGRSAALSWEDYFVSLAGYLIVDGLVATLIAAALLRESMGRERAREMTLGVITLTDAAGRALSGLVIMLWPGIAGFPVTGALFVAVMAVSTASVGLSEAWLTAREEVLRHGARHQPPQFMAGPVAIASLVSLAFGAGAFLRLGSPDDIRMMIQWFVAAAGAVALAMAWSHARMASQRAANPTSTD